ncbi:MAG: hypothetical protein WCG25_02325 [bacterium]
MKIDSIKFAAWNFFLKTDILGYFFSISNMSFIATFSSTIFCSQEHHQSCKIYMYG